MSTKTQQPAKTDTRTYFTAQEAAVRMRVSVDVVHAAISTGRLHGKWTAGRDPETGEKRRGGKTVISSEALDKWFDELEDA